MIGFSFQRALLNWSLGRVNEIATPGYDLKKIIDRWNLGKKTTVIANGVRCVQKTLGSPPIIKFDVISISRLVSWKNIDVLIEACKNSNLSLGIAGSGPLEDELKAMSLRLEGRVTFLGDLDESEVIEALGRVHIFALVSSYEGMSFGLLNAMMHSKRILVSDIPANTALIHNAVNGRVVPIRDVARTGLVLTELAGENKNNYQLERRAHEDAINFYCEEKQHAKIVALIK